MATIGDIEIERLLQNSEAIDTGKETPPGKVLILRDLRYDEETARAENLEPGIYFYVYNVTPEEKNVKDVLRIIKSSEPTMAWVLKSLGEFTYDSQFRATYQDYDELKKRMIVRVDHVYP